MTTSPTLKSQQFSFGIAGLIFGFVLGFVVAYQFYGGRPGAIPAAAPETMGGARPAAPGTPAAGKPPGHGVGGPGEALSPEMMDQVGRELNALKKAVEENPRDVTSLTRLGNMYMDAGMPDRAVQYYRTALEVEPANVDVRTDLGSCLQRMGKAAEAIKEFEQSIATDPKHWKSWFNIGIVCMYDLGDYDRALSAFQKVQDLNPGSFDLDAVRAEIEKLKSMKTGRGPGAPS
jgi:tetratricopeptide (TPR) repeat protein